MTSDHERLYPGGFLFEDQVQVTMVGRVMPNTSANLKHAGMVALRHLGRVYFVPVDSVDRYEPPQALLPPEPEQPRVTAAQMLRVALEQACKVCNAAVGARCFDLHDRRRPGGVRPTLDWPHSDRIPDALKQRLSQQDGGLRDHSLDRRLRRLGDLR